MKLSQFILQFLLVATCCDFLDAIVLNCNLFETTHNPLGYVYSCFLSRIDEIDEPKVTQVIGSKQKAGKSNKDVVLLNASKVRFDVIPTNIEKFFPNLIGLFMHNTGLKTIGKDDLKPFPSLQYLNVQNCNIEDLPDDIFVHNGKIKHLNFNKNKVKSIGSSVLASLPALSYANFEKNICVDAKAESSEQLELLKSKIVKCYRSDVNKDSNLAISDCPEPSCPRPNCALTRDTEIGRLKSEVNTLKIDAAELRSRNRKLQQQIAENPSKCQQTTTQKPNLNDVKALKTEIFDLKSKLEQQFMTVKTFKEELAKKSAEFKHETDKSVKCKQKLESATIALSEVTGRLKYYDNEGNPESGAKNFDKMSRGECVEALKSSTSDKESCGNKNEYLMDKLRHINSLGITCEVSGWSDGESCNAVNFKCLEENQKVSVVRSKHQKAVDKTKINELLVLNQHALFLPVGIGELFTNLIKMTLTNSHLTKLDSFALNFANLKFLSLAANKISEIYKSDLNNLARIETLDLSDNEISQIKSGAFESLSELKVLKLNGNKMMEIESDLFEKNAKLTSIFLRQNRLKFIGSEILAPLTSLAFIDFSDNVCVKAVYTEASLKELNQILSNHCGKPARLCCRFEKLSEKDVSCRAVDFNLQVKNTKLSSVKSLDDCIAEDSLIDPRLDPKKDNAANRVTILEIIDESVFYLPSNLGDHFKQLTKLSVISSKLKSLNKNDFSGLAFLNFVQVSDNDLTTLETELFSEVQTLQYLDISSNKITEFPPKFFENLTGLLFLNASNNDLERLEADLFPRRNSLEEIYFDRNDLSDVDPKIFRNLKNAKVIDFTGNPCINLKFPDEITRSELPNKAIYC